MLQHWSTKPPEPGISARLALPRTPPPGQLKPLEDSMTMLLLFYDLIAPAFGWPQISYGWLLLTVLADLKA